jgi:hypothetical protein
MTLQSSAPPRRGHGCLWGCLVVLVLISLPGLIAGWFFWQGFRQDPALRAAVELVRHDGTAQRVLGGGIHIVGVRSRSFAYALGLRAEQDYSIDLEGSLGPGVLDVRSHSERGAVKVDAMRLTGPDGRRYDLMNHGLPPSPPATIENSI